MLAAARQRRRSNHRRDYNNALPIDVKMQPSLVVVSGRRRAQTQLRTTILYCTVLYCTGGRLYVQYNNAASVASSSSRRQPSRDVESLTVKDTVPDTDCEK